MIKSKPRWTQEEEDLLIEIAERQGSLDEASHILNRSKDSIRKKFNRLEIWSEEEITEAFALYETKELNEVTFELNKKYKKDRSREATLKRIINKAKTYKDLVKREKAPVYNEKDCAKFIRLYNAVNKSLDNLPEYEAFINGK